MNDENFHFGGITDENPSMLAFVSDSSGINTVGSGIGHDIVAILDGNTEKPIILNDFYEADLNSYTSGTIRYPYLEFYVIKSDKFVISEISNYPNPFTEGTSFVFSHNQAEGTLDVTLRVFNLDGQIVKTFETSISPTGYRSEPIYWDGSADTGYSLSKGMYIYRILVKNEAGQHDDKSGKLILLK
jgi:hypothetical protein